MEKNEIQRVYAIAWQQSARIGNLTIKDNKHHVGFIASPLYVRRYVQSVRRRFTDHAVSVEFTADKNIIALEPVVVLVPCVIRCNGVIGQTLEFYDAKNQLPAADAFNAIGSTAEMSREYRYGLSVAESFKLKPALVPYKLINPRRTPR